MLINTWNELAQDAGFDGIYFICYCMTVEKYEGSKNIHLMSSSLIMTLSEKKMGFIERKYRRILSMLNWDKLLSLKLIPYDNYADTALKYYKEHPDASVCILPNYDHSPRSGKLARRKF